MSGHRRSPSASLPTAVPNKRQPERGGVPPKSFLFPPSGSSGPAKSVSSGKAAAQSRSSRPVAAAAAPTAKKGWSRASSTPAGSTGVGIGYPSRVLHAGHANDSESVNDALDRLLFESRACLDYLEGVNSKMSTEDRRRARRHAAKASGAPDFWKPRCGGWNLDGSDNDSDIDWSDLENDDSESSVDGDGDDEGLWRFLHAAAGKYAQPSRTPSSASTTARGGRTAAATAGASNAGMAGSSSAGAQPRQPRMPSGGRDHAHQSAHRQAGEANDAPRPPQDQQNDGQSNRGRAGGFQFGGSGSTSRDGAARGDGQAHSAGDTSHSAPAVGSGGAGCSRVEAEITRSLVSAQTEGKSAVRKVLKRLLLRWHPDKAPQGDSQEDAAARSEATRVLRFVLQERQRLGL